METLFQLISKYLIRNSKFTEYNQIHHTTESRNTYMGNRISKIKYLQIVIKMYVIVVCYTQTYTSIEQTTLLGTICMLYGPAWQSRGSGFVKSCPHGLVDVS